MGDCPANTFSLYDQAAPNQPPTVGCQFSTHKTIVSQGYHWFGSPSSPDRFQQVSDNPVSRHRQNIIAIDLASKASFGFQYCRRA